MYTTLPSAKELFEISSELGGSYKTIIHDLSVALTDKAQEGKYEIRLELPLFFSDRVISDLRDRGFKVTKSESYKLRDKDFMGIFIKWH